MDNGTTIPYVDIIAPGKHLNIISIAVAIHILLETVCPLRPVRLSAARAAHNKS